jgi:hypothetical protein
MAVRLTGRRIRKSDAPWLDCVFGKPGVIGTGVYRRIAQEEKLALSQPPDAGLIEDLQRCADPLSILIKLTHASGTSTNTPRCTAWKSGAKSTLPANLFSGC